MTQSLCPQKTPYEVNVEEGKTYFWCTCGLSQKQPFCDGAHKGSGLKSQYFTAEVTGKMWLCGCKQSKNPPFCDSSHLKIEP
ncbi:MAG: glutamate synthase [Alphaproteobacteria bacterium 41-28]|nr:MAG: glutamate synthase [Alphaproteobacteria bacterium 41-28]